ncbi:CCCH zinc finger DNA binding protein [Aspergillus ambiguus]|uniref:CCCH zinc finger DNA binding protein n=1 Tax=Aspergillus ambiguus TaxID=176160 RepID=UPI003CCE24BE
MRNIAKLQFVAVLVDGDHMNFMDEFVRGGQKGGRSAAKALMKAVRDHVHKAVPDTSPHIQYMVHVYANVTGLAKTYRDTGIISSKDVLESFIQGFNMENQLCDFVDAGSGKECSDVKIRALFEQCVVNVHCQYIIFCGSADNGYARVLGSHRGSRRISLVEGPPFASELRDLASEFETTSFPEVFRSTKLTRRVSFGGAAISPTVLPPRTPTPNYASVARMTPPVLNEGSLLDNPPRNTIGRDRVRLMVCKNVNGDRVDTPLREPSKGKIEALKSQKFCNQFQILGECTYRSCTYKHTPKLEGPDLLDLMVVARLSACPDGLQCYDERCISGHLCPHKTCMGKGCRFPHGVDTRIVTPL